MVMFLSDQPGNIAAMKKVIRGDNQKRERPQGHSRFTGDIVRDDESIRSSIGSDSGEKNGLGKKWRKIKNKTEFPSLVEIMRGIL